MHYYSGLEIHYLIDLKPKEREGKEKRDKGRYKGMALWTSDKNIEENPKGDTREMQTLIFSYGLS